MFCLLQKLEESRVFLSFQERNSAEVIFGNGMLLESAQNLISTRVQDSLFLASLLQAFRVSDSPYPRRFKPVRENTLCKADLRRGDKTSSDFKLQFRQFLGFGHCFKSVRHTL